MIGLIVASPTLFLTNDNFAGSYNVLEEERAGIYLPNLDDIKSNCKHFNRNLTDIYRFRYKKDANGQRLLLIPEPNTIVLGGIGTIIVIWLKRSGLL